MYDGLLTGEKEATTIKRDNTLTIAIFFTIFRLFCLNAITLRKVVKNSTNRKNPPYNLRRSVVTLFIIFLPFIALSQELDSASTKSDSLAIDIKSGSVLSLSDSTVSATNDSTKVPKGDIETTVNYAAKDSINLNLKTQDVNIYGEGNVDYGDIKLEAAEIKVNYKTNILDANGVPDSLGKLQGKPIFTDAEQVYQTEEITYNFKTRKAIIKGVVTQQGEAFMHGERIKKNEKDELFVKGAKYTTCNLEEPHFHISSDQIKLIPNDKLLAGPFNLKVNDVPTPFVFPFGLFPMPNNKVSGILFPTYGEENRRGFFLRDGGYYWAISEYVDMALRGEIYSKGSYGFSVATNYKKRYSYSGTLNFRFNSQKVGQSETDSLRSRDFWLQWSHRPESRGTGRFSASVNLGSSSYNQNNPTNDYNQQVNTNFNSSVSYSNVIAGTPFNYAISGRHSQNVRTNEIDVLLPEFALNMNRVYPFKNIQGDNMDWLSKVSFSYNFTATNRLSNSLPDIEGEDGTDSIADFNFETMPALLDRAQNGGKHTIPLSTSFTVLKNFTVSPNFNYDEYWYLRELTHRYDPELKEVVIDTVSQFSRANSYSAGVGVSTRLYGTVYTKGNGPVKAIRHVMTPSMSFSWRPDFSEERYGIYREVQTDSLGNTRLFSKYQGFVYGSPGSGKSGTISLSLTNNLEMKVKSKNDTSDAPKKVKIFENLSLGTSYNIIADSFKLSPISINARTKLFNNKLDINLQTTLDPYVMVLDSVAENSRGVMQYYQHRIDRYTWQEGLGLGRLTSANLSLSTNLNPAGKKSDDENRNDIEGRAREAGASEQEINEIVNNPEAYVDFEIPWNLRIRYNIRWSRQGFEEPTITQTSNFSGDVNLTEKWKIGFTSGFDFEKDEFTQTSFTIFRDLHCWQINANWTPFGRFQSFSVDLRVKASILQDLKLNRRRSWWDN